ncbi:hypothetical protein [Nonomuraea zeae]|uniref:Uncharacterized protein n=1 Tax=Nonomuraea zeae TaxID=1642303 RepID=A0A5S4GQG0_9ACTN|nr:hypothetical protein [Nonomuraea zeae]TMR35195.1 hypothetical protein ETD85_14440 [Nonomuraea zeae]
MGSDELKVPSQRADRIEEEDERDREPGREGDEFPRTDLAAHERDRDEHDELTAHERDGHNDLAGHDRDALDGRDEFDDRMPGRTGPLADDHAPVPGGALPDDDEFARSERPTEELPPGERTPGDYDDEPGRQTPRAGDEHATPLPGAVTVSDDDSPYRDPYATTGGDMLTDAQPDPAHTPAAADEVPAHAAPQDVFLFDQDPVEVQARWRELQASFVDDPGESVQQADGLVSEVVESLTSTLTSRTSALRDRWKDAETSDTEELRLALRDYRSVLERLLALSSKSPQQFQR